MTSTLLMTLLLVVYVVIAGVSLFEGNYPRAVYWVSAASLTASVLWMGGQP